MFKMNSTHALMVSRVLLSLFLLTTAMSRFTSVDSDYFAKQLTAVGLPAIAWLSALLGAVQLTVVIALIFPKQKLSQYLLYSYSLLALIPILMLLTHPVWIDSLGGFPAIGAGQGLIKYLAIAGVSGYIASHYAGAQQLKRLSLKLIWAGIVLVMLWIGGMKFTQIEADGIERLMATSPFFSWIYQLFSVLHGSYFIGVIELIAVLGLVLGLKYHSAKSVGLAMGALTFLATQTFIISLPAYELSHGLPLLTGSGQFIVKDLVLLAGCILLYSASTRPDAQS
ncbi:DUF417 family protein [Shewanella eurypsychrophilus]|uniref:DUF417 family protein n=1 Tax=Shewanella eurypsychrophilus TaxID=2593656 RepID=A0ABX6V1I4_9GAMM|nr:MULTISPECIES: DUF417 family protein [Shewanella]QFU21102.1 DUF417 family protein [Shewanella sp. YLB-09]QPG56391.1 DUF417 family protein [Shewanella eurypsychrophilus]